MYFSNNSIYKKFLTITLCTSLIACSCPKSITVDSIQKHDKKLTCKDTIMEINESEFYRRKAQSNKGAQLDYVLNPLCYPSGFFSANRGQSAANDRLEYLNNIYDLLNCSEVDINNAGGAVKRVLQPNNDARNLQLQQRPLQQIYQPQGQYRPNIPYQQQYSIPNNRTIPRPNSNMIQKGIGYIPRQVIGTSAGALKNLGVAGAGIAAGTAVGASGKALSGASAAAGAVAGVGIGAAAGAFGRNNKQQQLENRHKNNGKKSNNYNEYEDVRSAKHLYDEIHQGEQKKTLPTNHDFDFLPIPVQKPNKKKTKKNKAPVTQKLPTNSRPQIPINAIPLLGGSKHPSYEACVSYSGCIGHNNNIVDKKVDSKKAQQQLPIIELPKSEPIAIQNPTDKINDLEIPISEQDLQNSSLSIDNDIKDIEEMIDMESMDHDLDSYMDKINDTQ